MLLRLYCLLFLVTLFLPTLQHSLNIVPSTILSGEEEAPTRNKWSVTGWLDGSFQEQYGKRRDARLGLRSHMVKTYNQLHYSLFHRVVSTKGTNVVIGKENWLYEKVYIDKLHRPARDDGTLIDSRVRGLRTLQDQLEERGISFVYIIAPSKAEVYPEYIPDKLLKKPLPLDTATDYRQARAALEKHGVNFVDSHTLFLQEKQEKRYQLFGPSGVHWNKYGAYLAWKNLEQLLKEQLKVPLQIPPLEQVVSRPSDYIEADLGGLLNLWDPALTSPVTDYPVFTDLKTENRKKPTLLIVGDSFMFTLLDIIAKAGFITDTDAWFYYKRHFHYPVLDGRINISALTDTPLDKNNMDWQNQLLNKDLVILMSTEYWLPNMGWGFIEEASAALEKLNHSN